MNRLLFMLRFAWKNLGRAPWRTAVMVLGLCFGTGYTIFSLNFSASGSREIMDDFLAQYFGRHQVVHPRYYPEVDKKNFNPEWTVAETAVAQLPAHNYARRVTLPVFLSGPRKTLGTLLTGVEPEKELRLTHLGRAVRGGAFLSTAGGRELMLGARLARKLGAGVGDPVAVIGQGIDGSVANDMFRVAALLDFGGGDMEDALAFTALDDARAFAAIPGDRFHQYVYFGPADVDLPRPKGATAVSWQKILPEIAGALEFMDGFTWLVTTILALVISLGMANTLLVTFMERDAEFTALNTIGVGSRWVAFSLGLEVLFVGALGIGLGVLLGEAITSFFNAHPISMLIFTGGQPLMMGGMPVIPEVRLWHDGGVTLQAASLMAVFLSLGMLWPLYRVLQRSRRAH